MKQNYHNANTHTVTIQLKEKGGNFAVLSVTTSIRINTKLQVGTKQTTLPLRTSIRGSVN